MQRSYLTWFLTLIFIMVLTVQPACGADQCAFDLDHNGDVDGRDLYLFTQLSNPTTQEYTDFAEQWGRTGCLVVPENLVPADVDNGLSADSQQGGDGIVGKTVCLLNGNNFEIRTDLDFPSPNRLGLGFRAVFNSQSAIFGSMGHGWSHNYAASLDSAFVISGVTFLKITDDTGRGRYFTEAETGLYEGAFNEPSYVREEAGQFVWYRLDGSRYLFSLSGKLDAIEDESLNRLEVSYNVRGDIDNITDQSSGRVITINYNPQFLIESISGPVTAAVPSGIWVTYQYGGNHNLTTVTYADNSGFSYIYDDPYDAHNLTKKHNAANHLLNTWSFNSLDRCVGKFSRDGTGVAIDYIDQNEAEVTDAYGTVRTYTLTMITGRKRVTAMLGTVGAPYNDSSIIRWAYDDQMNLIEAEQADGTLHRYLFHDARGNPGTVILASNTDEPRTVTYTYHPWMNAVLTRTETSVTGFGNKETVYDYDDDYDGVANQNPTGMPGRVVEKGITNEAAGAIVPYEYVTIYTYNNLGQLLTVDGPRAGSDDTTTYEYDPGTGNLQSVTQPLVGTTVYSDHDAAGRPETMTDVNQQPTTYVYDGRARVVEITHSDHSSIYLPYNTAGTLESKTDEDGIIHDYTYDATYGRLFRITDVLGNYVEYDYDAQGNVIDIGKFDASDNRSTWRRFNYQHPDIPGRLYREINPDDTYTEYGYDTNGNLSTVKDPKQASAGFTHDPFGRLKTTTQPGSITTVFAYDSHGDLKSVTDANTHQTTYEYDDMGRVVSTTSPDTGTTAYHYDAAGNTKGRSDAKGVAVSYDYDPLNRLTAIQFPDTTQNLGFSYDQGIYGMGRRTGLTDPSGITQFIYDKRGRLAEKTVEMSGRNYRILQSYTSAGRTTSITYPSTRTVDYARNSCVCRIDGVTTTHDGTTHTLIENLSYRPFAGASGLDNGPGGSVSNIYDKLGRIDIANPGAPKERIYDYDPNGNLTDITANDPARYTQSFTYNDLNRLTGAQGGVYGTIGYTYDDVGNRLTHTVNGMTATYTYIEGTNKIDQITGVANTVYGHDANGNITGMGNRTFVYNQNNRLVRVEQDGSVLAVYTYNALGRRVKKVAGGKTTLFHYDLDGDLIAESDTDGVYTAEYLYNDKALLAKVDVANNRVLFYHNSYRGFPQALVDDTNTVVWEGLYRPFGQVLVNPFSSAGNNLRFAGQYYDAETGLHYNYHRYYDPSLGRYLRADPIGLLGGINLYAYVQNNPANYIDPYGLQRGRGNNRYHRRQQTQRSRQIRNLEKAIKQHDPSFRYEVLRDRHGRIRQSEVDHLRDILNDHVARRQAEFYESLKPRPRTRDRIRSLEDAIEQLEGIYRQQRLTPERIESIQKSLDRLRHELSRLQNEKCP